MNLDAVIRKVSDFPKPGVLFLGYAEKIGKYKVIVLQKYHGE